MTHPPLIVQIPTGDQGALHALAAMRVAADRLAARPETAALIRSTALQRAGTGNDRAALDALFYWIKDHYQYQPDPSAAEYQHDHAAQVRALIDFPRSPALGDCDDRAVFTAALAQALGFTTRFVAVSSSQDQPLHHVYTAAMLGPSLYALDSQVCAAAGIEPPGIARAYVK